MGFTQRYSRLHIGNSSHGSAPSFAATATVGGGCVVSKASQDYRTQYGFGRRAVDLTVWAKSKQPTTMILSGAEAVKTAVSKSELTYLALLLIFYT